MEDKSGVGRNAISLPQGGGGVEGVGSLFSVDHLRGRGSYRISIVAPPGRGGLNPELSLVYQSDAGFGPLGLGWSLSHLHVTRRTDVGVPTYSNTEDTFSFKGEELLSLAGGAFRARIEKDFWKIQQVSDHWEVRGQDGRFYVLGETANERLSNPSDPSQVLTWMISRIQDPNGNIIRFTYRRDTRTVTPAPGMSFQAGQLYLDQIQYNPQGSAWLYEIKLVYDFDNPTGSARPDARLTTRPGFPLYIGWRLSRVEVRANVPGEHVGPIRSYELSYTADPETGLALLASVQVTGHDTGGATLSLPPVAFTYSRLDSIDPGVEPLDGAPQIDFATREYELVDLTSNGLPDLLHTTVGNHTFWLNNRWRQPVSLAPGERDFAPGTAMLTSPNLALTQPAVHLADIRGKVAADLVADTGLLDSPSYAASYNNIVTRQISWGPGNTFTTPPPFNFHDGKARVVDLTGRGRMDVLRADANFHHWLNKPGGQYEDRGTSPQIPGLSFTNAEWTFADINGDGLADLIRVQNGRIEVYLNRGAGHRSGNLFETTPIVMGNSQALRQGVTEWNPERMIFIDINGDGYDDAVYLHTDRIICWTNRGGWAWGDARVIPYRLNGSPTLLTNSRPSVRVGNIRGTGTTGIVWSSTTASMKFMDIARGKKPLLLSTIDNGIGLQTQIDYHPTTLANGKEWRSRIPFTLHVVKKIIRTDATTGHTQMVEYQFTDGAYDRTRREFLGFGEVQTVEVGDESAPDPVCATRITNTRYHLGESTATDPILRARDRALAGLPYRRAVSGADPTQPYQITEWLYETAVTPDFTNASLTVFGTNGQSERDSAGNPIPEPSVLALQTHELELIYEPSAGGATSRADSLGGTLTIQSYRDSWGRLDVFGRTRSTTEAMGIRVTSSPGSDEETLLTVDPVSDRLTIASLPTGVRVVAPLNIVKRTNLTYAENTAAHHVSEVARILTRTEGKVVEDVRRYYDGSDYVGLPLSQLTAGNLMREEALVLRDDQHQEAYGDWPGGAPDLLILGYHRGEYGNRRLRFRWFPRIFRWFWRRPWFVKWFVWFFQPEGYGYFNNVRRYRYATVSGGGPAYGFLTGFRDALDIETSYTPDAYYLHTLSQTDAAGNLTAAQPDYRTGKLAQSTDPNGHVTRNVYDPLGRVLAVIKPGDNQAFPSVEFVYPTAGSPLPTSVKTRVREQAGVATTFDATEYFDGWGRAIQKRMEAEGGQFAVTGARRFNARGGVADRFLPHFSASDAYAAPPSTTPLIRRVVDARDRETEVRYPDGSVLRRQFLGYAVEESDREDTDSASPHFATPTRTVRDARDNVTEVHQRLSGSTIVAAYQYDIFSQLRGVRLSGGSAGSVIIRYFYDLLEHRIRVEHQDANAVRIIFNAAGQEAFRSDALGRVTETRYDVAGRRLERRFPSTSEPSITYRYCDTAGTCHAGRNLKGRVMEITDGGGTVALSYDARGNVSRHERTWDEGGIPKSYAVDFKHDSSDRLTHTTYPQLLPGVSRLELEHRYNEANLLEGMDLRMAGVVTPLLSDIDYDVRGMRTKIVYGNGLQTDLTYDPIRLTLIGITTAQPGNAALQELACCHDRESNLSILHDKRRQTAQLCTYDALYRLTELKEVNTNALGSLPTDCNALRSLLASQAGTVQSYSYSGEGDLLNLGSAGALVYSSLAGRPHGKITHAGNDYEFNGAGSLERMLTADGAATLLSRYDYDSRGRVSKIELPQQDRVIRFQYDYEGELLAKTVNKISDGSLVSETRYLGRWITFDRPGSFSSWQNLRLQFYEEDRLVAVSDANGTVLSVIHRDHLGSSELISNSAGQELCTLHYGPFGSEQTPGNCSDLRHRYVGKLTDADTGLVHFGARDYLPKIGRWTSPDPLLWSEPEKHLANPQAMNAFSYAVNNPLTLIDPVGRSPGKYAGEYIDTRANHVEFYQPPNGPPVAVLYRVVIAKPGTWLSKITYDFGWGQYYSKEKGYGAYNPTIIFPLSGYEGLYDPDKIKPGQQFAVRIAPERRIELPPVVIEGRTNHSKEWSWRVLAGGAVGAVGQLESYTLEIRNDKTRNSALFTYFGSGFGVGAASVSAATPWSKFKTDKAVSLDDFEGEASHIAGGFGYGGEEFTLWNPWRAGKTDRAVTLRSHGPAFPSVGGTHGHLERRND